ncbi:TetR/AcrR family transcriptional regulator [Streptomyces smaragdinus]|uniref:TetR/AcrR family transcriptional regulator n=1 Tax=Streptomyces smaragdinus TaxID=2585196 RepID=UPI002B1FFED2|nr:TetR/AcrR family transcriptional regulator [Streptomyces smaragdinus]
MRRTRLTSEQRREQLLAVGAGLFAERPYDEVWIEEVAELAAVSRGLLYHYFPTKRDFFAAVVRAESERILALTEPDPALGVLDQLVAGLDAYLEYVEAHRTGYLVMHRAAVSVDEGIRAVFEESVAVQQQRIVDAVTALREPDDTVRVAARGWLMFVISVCLDWLERATVTRAELRDLCARTLLAAVGVDADGRPLGAQHFGQAPPA